MGLNDRETIDYLSLSRGGREIVATLLDVYDGDDDAEHFWLLQEKVKRYLDFIDSGEVYDAIHRTGQDIPRSTPVRIDIVAPRELPGSTGQRFLEHWREAARHEGIALTFRVQGPERRLVVRASLAATTAEEAASCTHELRAVVDQWGQSEILHLKSDSRSPGEFTLALLLSMGPQDALTAVRELASLLCSGSWELHEEDPAEPWAVWDGRAGGRATVPSVTWLCLEMLPP